MNPNAIKKFLIPGTLPLHQQEKSLATLRIGCGVPRKLSLNREYRAALCSTPFKPDDHSEVVPLLPIPNRTVKHLSADDSAGSRVKVGHRQATIEISPPVESRGGFLLGLFTGVIPRAMRLRSRAQRSHLPAPDLETFPVEHVAQHP